MNTASPSALSMNSATTEDKTTAIVSYLTLIGFVVAIILHSSKKTRLGAFHLRQSLGLILLSIAVALTTTVFSYIPFLGWLASLAAWVGLFILWVIGLLAAINGEMKPVPVVGEHLQKWLGTAFD